MRHGTANRRSRNNRGRNRSGNSRSHVYDSNGPDVRIRGTAHQVAEKYEALAKDAAGAGDIIMAENYLQHAEHYLRIISSWNEENNFTAESEENDENSRYESQRKPKNSKRSSPKQEQKEDLGLPSSILGVNKKEETLEEA